MPTSIPYDHPSLVLGNIVDARILNALHEVSALQNSIDITQDKLNSHIALKRSFDMTISELKSMNVDTMAIDEKIKKINESIKQAAKEYLDKRLENEEKIVKKREEISRLEVGEAMESPLNYGTAKLKGIPLSSESLKLDAQYFSHEKNNALSNIKDYVQESTSHMGSTSSKLGKAVSAQVHQQQKSHNLSGTLFITASCTHKNIGVIEPFDIDVDKAIDLWNAHKTKKINRDYRKMKALESQTTSTKEETISIISGAAYGSSFVGMVHIIRNENATTNPSEEDLKKLQEKMKLSGWIQYETGGFGVEPSVAEDIKRLLNAYEMSSHISVIVMGATASFKANNLMSGFKEFASSNSYITRSKSINTRKKETRNHAAEKIKNRTSIAQMEHEKAASLMQTLGAIDSKTNKVMDINTLMTAFDNYLKEIAKTLKKEEGVVGTPIHFYLKKITASQIARLWLANYYTDKVGDKKE